MTPLLSICIPTYNRCDKLKQTLDSITSQSVFIKSSDIEICISDNNSNDNTYYVVSEFIEKFGDKIIYNKNPENIQDKNFNKALSLGNGDFLKLYNDTLVMKENALNSILGLVKNSLNEKPVLFFANGAAKQQNKCTAFSSFEDFFKSASFNVTWIGAFGIWKEDYEKIVDFEKAASLQLIQVDILFRMFESKKNSVIDNNAYFVVPPVEKKGGYDVIQVFADNYFQLLQAAIERGILSIKNYKIEQKQMLFNFFIPWFATAYSSPDKYFFEIKNWPRKLRKHYPFYIIILAQISFMLKILLLVPEAKLKKIKNWLLK